MSNESLSRLIVVAQSTDVVFQSMITLTYPREFPWDGEVVKEDIHAFTQWCRKRFKSEYLWFLEFQKRGAPHVHLMLETSELTPKMRVDAATKWTHRLATSEWLRDRVDNDFDRIRLATIRMMKFNCHEQFWQLLRNKDNARRYVTKYAAKSFQKEVPKDYWKVGRFWGSSKNVPKEGITIDVTDDEVRQYLSEHQHIAKDWALIPKYLFNVKDYDTESEAKHGRDDDSDNQPRGSNGSMVGLTETYP